MNAGDLVEDHVGDQVAVYVHVVDAQHVADLPIGALPADAGGASAAITPANTAIPASTGTNQRRMPGMIAHHLVAEDANRWDGDPRVTSARRSVTRDRTQRVYQVGFDALLVDAETV